MSNRRRLEKLRDTYKKQVIELQLQEAKFGVHVPVNILTHLEELRDNIKDIEAQLSDLSDESSSEDEPLDRLWFWLPLVVGGIIVLFIVLWLVNRSTSNGSIIIIPTNSAVSVAPSTQPVTAIPTLVPTFEPTVSPTHIPPTPTPTEITPTRIPPTNSPVATPTNTIAPSSTPTSTLLPATAAPVSPTTAPLDDAPVPEPIDTATPEPAPPEPVSVPDGLIGYWNFDGSNGDDISINHNAVQGEFKFSTEVQGKSLELHNEQFTLSEKPQNIKSLEDFSISFWFKTSKQYSQALVKSTIGKTNGVPSYAIFINSNGKLGDLEAKLVIKSGDGNHKEAHTSSGNQDVPKNVRNLESDKWHHVIVTRFLTKDEKDTTNTFILYVDGLKVDIEIIKGPNGQNYDVPIEAQRFPGIGNDTDGPESGGQFEGSVDEIRIYDRALNLGEVTTLYQEGKSRLAP